MSLSLYLLSIVATKVYLLNLAFCVYVAYQFRSSSNQTLKHSYNHSQQPSGSSNDSSLLQSLPLLQIQILPLRIQTLPLRSHHCYRQRRPRSRNLGNRTRLSSMAISLRKKLRITLRRVWVEVGSMIIRAENGEGCGCGCGCRMLGAWCLC